MSPLPKAVVSWSSGKDCAWALHTARVGAEVELVGLLTTVSTAFGRVSMHGVRETLLDRQAELLGLPCTKVRIPTPCPNETYERAMSDVLAALRAQEVTHVVFGDLFLEDLRAYRVARLAEVGMHAVFPLWHRNTRELAHEMLAGGLRASVTCVDPRKLAPSFAGRSFDETFLRALPEDVDPCGENGEFHTLATSGPMFAAPLEVQLGEIVERDGFVFADLLG